MPELRRAERHRDVTRDLTDLEHCSAIHRIKFLFDSRTVTRMLSFRISTLYCLRLDRLRISQSGRPVSRQSPMVACNALLTASTSYFVISQLLEILVGPAWMQRCQRGKPRMQRRSRAAGDGAREIFARNGHRNLKIPKIVCA